MFDDKNYGPLPNMRTERREEPRNNILVLDFYAKLLLEIGQWFLYVGFLIFTAFMINYVTRFVTRIPIVEVLEVLAVYAVAILLFFAVKLFPLR